MPKILDDTEIYLATIRTVNKRGFRGATTKQIAREAEVSEVTLFRKFGSKMDLMKRAIEYVVSQIDYESAAQYTGNIEKDLFRMTKTYFNGIMKNGDFISAIVMELSREDKMKELIVPPQQMFISFGKLIERYHKEGLLKPEKPLKTMSALLGPLVYSYLLAKAFPNLGITEIDIEEHVNGFLHGRQIKTT